MPPQTPPGSYVLRVRATTGTSKQAERDHTLVLEAPPEGIVDSAAISLEKNGEAVSTAHAPEKELWVRFHFSSLPENAREVRIVWRTPSFRLVGAVVKRATATTDSFIRVDGPACPRQVVRDRERRRHRRQASQRQSRLSEGLLVGHDLDRPDLQGPLISSGEWPKRCQCRPSPVVTFTHRPRP